jgi:hypothetical protein
VNNDLNCFFNIFLKFRFLFSYIILYSDFIIGKPKTCFYHNIVYYYPNNENKKYICNRTKYIYDHYTKEIREIKCNRPALHLLKFEILDLDIRTNNGRHSCHLEQPYYKKKKQFIIFRLCNRCPKNISQAINTNPQSIIKISSQLYYIKDFISYFINKILKQLFNNNNCSELISSNIQKFI